MKKVDVVGAIIVNEKKEVLCALRSQNMSLPGLWEFPGGKIEEGEDPKDSLVREIKEELDCEIEVGDLVVDATHEYPTVVVRLITYFATIVHGEPKASEHEKLTWLSKSELSSLNWAPADLPTLDRLVNEDLL
ncbi:8-oxo-dGTP diphosphatase [Tumebacillus sp. BK434]|uniref:(deoxy)nucleoside triphosphate pyrophosphohydrolase n=1 Tax=Tumebacillus sp. BK434 TaxID=2512169 RepID=UPI001049B425|nr:(deoxy)nucleoside triphosphate pyrophosphohydrolase [Tumebacillus sp. BK434]TCP54629.1 8-oxo-dGTP diphosphatase [Tumebacillus sp. BK434]